MTARDEDIAWYRELLEPLGTITVRRMFGGAGLYADGLIVGLEIEGTLYLKTDASSRDLFADAGGRPFVYDGKDKQVTVASYWTPPDEAMDSPEAMRPWARLALEAALRSAVGKKPVKKTAKKAIKKSS
ncbi:MAG: TfoX/Sxy family protein [Lysobacteraceae bacterium]